MPRYLTLDEAVERIMEDSDDYGDEVEREIIPPEENDRDTEDEDEPVDRDVLPNDVAGNLEVILPEEDPQPPAIEQRRWRTATRLDYQRLTQCSRTFQSSIPPNWEDLFRHLKPFHRQSHARLPCSRNTSLCPHCVEPPRLPHKSSRNAMLHWNPIVQ